MCLTRPDFYFKVLLMTLSPIVVGVLLLLYALRLKVLGREWDNVYSVFLAGTYCVFPTVSQAVFQIFACDDDFDHGETYLRLDYSVSCKGPSYGFLRAYGVLMTFVYPIGIPLMCKPWAEIKVHVATRRRRGAVAPTPRGGRAAAAGRSRRRRGADD